MSSAPTRPLEVPPYNIQLLIDSVVNDFAEIVGASSDPGIIPSQVRCAQALGKDLYVGCANGLVIRFALEEHPHRSQPAGYKLVSQHPMPGNKPVDEIALAPSVSKILVQSDGQLRFFVYPGMEPVPTNLIAPIRMVATFTMDVGAPDAHPPAVRFSVVKRTGIASYTLRERLFYDKDINLQGVRAARRFGQHLCIVNAERLYCMVNLQTGIMLPMMPVSQEEGTVVRPLITVIGSNEFLVVSYMGAGAVGVFMTGDADPVRGTLQWNQYPDSICIDFPYIVSLLPNRSIEIHSINTMEIVHVISPPVPTPVFLEPRILVPSPGLFVPSAHRIEKLSAMPITILPRQSPTSFEHKREGESNLTPPPTPGNSDTSGQSKQSTELGYARSGVVVLGPNGIQTLVPTTLISQTESLLESNRIEDAIELAEQTRKRNSMNASGIEDDTAEELHYAYQRIGYLCMAATRFEDAGNYLFRGELDPRLLLRHFPEFQPSPLLVAPDKTANVYAGIIGQLQALGSINDIIAANLVMNYSPHLSTDDSVLVTLTAVLKDNARQMLQSFLRKARNRRAYDSTAYDRETIKVVNTILLRILAESPGAEIQEMLALVHESDETIVLPDVEQSLLMHKRYPILVSIYERRRDTGKLLDLLANLVQENWASADVPDPLARLLQVLEQISDAALLQKWGLWLIKRDAIRGINVLKTARDKRSLPKKIAENADATLLKQIREVSTDVADQYLEYLVLKKQSTDSGLHSQLAQRCVGDLLNALNDDSTATEFKDMLTSYLGSARTVPFLAHVAFNTPETNSKRQRLKTILFLQGSPLFDVTAIREQLAAKEDLLAFECAILDGKLGHHRNALTTLATTLQDALSAETYCSLNGIIVPPRLAIPIAERAGLQTWAMLLHGSIAQRVPLRASDGQDRLSEIHEDSGKRELLQMLMEVYMQNGGDNAEHTARLLNAQALHLNIVDVITAVPPAWPLTKLTSFLSRSLRRTLHSRHEGMIIKAISAGQNLEVTDAHYVHTLAQGALVEEPLPVDENMTKGEIIEKLVEKVVDIPEP